MGTEELKQRRQRHQDRVTLDQECLHRVDSWIEQVTTAAKGVTLSRRDVVNWLVKQHAESLSAGELNELRAKYFSEVRFLRQAIRDLKTAQQQGETVTLEDILSATRRQLIPHPSKRRTRRKHAAPSTVAVESVDESQMVNVLE